MSLTPFDLKLIMKKFEFFQKQLKYKGYYDFARRNHEEHILQTDFEKPVNSPHRIPLTFVYRFHR